MSLPHVSVIIPCRNEARYIRRSLESLLAGDYPGDLMEVLVVDGTSDDGTPDIVNELARRDPRIHLLQNPKRIVPTAMNIGISNAQGAVIVRMDAHNEYPPDYVSGLVSWLERTGADNVGGAWITVPADDSVTARAIALALAHPFGVGNAQFRLGVTAPTKVDTVPFGCFRRELFDRIGLFDEELVRNQDDELNFRILRSGGTIVLVPDIVSRYYARPSLGQLARMYFQYGYFKPLVAFKIGRVMTARQLAPPALALALVATAALAPWFPRTRLALVLLLASYLAALLLGAVTAGRGRSASIKAALLAAFLTLHLSYGFGFLAGSARLLIRKWRPGPAAESVPLSR